MGLRILTLLLLSSFLSAGNCTRQEKTDTQEGKKAPQEGEACQPSDERWYPVDGDEAAFLFCDVERKKLKLHKCNFNDGLFKIFDPKRQQCVVKNEEYRWLLMAPPAGVPTKKVGDDCVVNRDCSDGMYCYGGRCQCYLNYIEINSLCVRVSSVCQSTTFYPEAINGKPKICSATSPCPPGYVCKSEPSGALVVKGQENGFCCLVNANEVCGQSTPHIANGHPVHCYSSNFSESCPSGHVCQSYEPANRHYCCQGTGKMPDHQPVNSSVHTATSTPNPPLEVTKARHSQQPDPYCGNNAIAYLYDGFPIVCNPGNAASCPKDFPCQKNEKINLHFCCQNITAATPQPNAHLPPPPSPPPPPPLPPFSNLVIPEGSTAPNSATGQSPFPNNLGQIIGGAISGRPVDFCGATGRPFIFDGRPVTCAHNDSLSCPHGYTCTIYQPFNASFCCRTSPPSESHLPYESTTQAPVTYTTSTSTKSSTSGQSVCGSWGVPYTYEGYPVTCVNHGVNSTCPPDYICQYHAPSTAHFCCRGAAPDSSGGPTPTTQATHAPYLAISNPDGCPPQTYAARDPSGVIQVCDLLLAPETCPTGTGCLYSALFGRYQCCGARLERWPHSSTTTVGAATATATATAATATVSNGATASTASTPSTPFTLGPANSSAKKLSQVPKQDECSPGQIAYRDPSSNETATCAANHPDSCPGGYFCQWSDKTGKFLCCGVSSGCPNNGVSYVSAATWEVQRCGPQDATTACPPGYSCQLNSDGAYVCCSNPSLKLTPPLNPPMNEIPEKTNANFVPQPLPSPTHLCSAGLPFSEQQAGGYKTCSESAICPQGYQCSASSVGTVCCPVYLTKSNPPLWNYYFSNNHGARARKS